LVEHHLTKPVCWFILWSTVSQRPSKRLSPTVARSCNPSAQKYLCLCYYDAEKEAQLSQEELEAIGPACKPHDAALRATGKVVVQGSLAPYQEWKTIRPVNGTPVVSDGPLLNIPQLAGAFLIVDADTIDEATAVASKHAAANYGEHIGMAVEVRQCESFD